jgi:hypothetical protein
MRMPCPANSGASLVEVRLPTDFPSEDSEGSPGSIIVISETSLRAGVALNVSAKDGVFFLCDSDGALALLHTGIVSFRGCDNREEQLSVLQVLDPQAHMLQLVLQAKDFSMSAASDSCDLLLGLPPFLLQCDVDTVLSRSFWLRIETSAKPVAAAAPATLLAVFVASFIVGDAVPEAQFFAMSSLSPCIAKNHRPAAQLLHQHLVSPFATNTGAVNGLASSLAALVVVWGGFTVAVTLFKFLFRVPWDRASHWLYFPGLPVFITSVLTPSVILNSLRLWLQLRWEISHSAVSLDTAVFLIVAGLIVSAAYGASVVFMARAASNAALREAPDSDGGLLAVYFTESAAFRETRRRAALNRTRPQDAAMRFVAWRISWLPAKAESRFGPLFTALHPTEASQAVAMWAVTICLGWLYAVPAMTRAACGAIHFVALLVVLAMFGISVHAIAACGGLGSYASMGLSWVHACAQLLLVAAKMFDVAFVVDEAYQTSTGLNSATIGLCSMFAIISIVLVALRVLAWATADRGAEWGVEDTGEGRPAHLVHISVALEEELLKT